MIVNDLEIKEIGTTPPPLELTPEEIETLADELVAYHAEFADLYYRIEQAHWGYLYLQGLMAPIESKTIQSMAMALEGGDVQAIQQFIGQGKWRDEKLLQKHWRLVRGDVGRGGWGLDRGWLRVSQAREAFGGSSSPMVWSIGQGRELSGGTCGLPLTPVARGTPCWIGGSICPRSGLTKITVNDGRSAVSLGRYPSRPSLNWPWRC